MQHLKKPKEASRKINYTLQNFKNINLVNKIETPCMIVDLDKVIGNCKKFKKLMPDVELFYAVKAYYSKELIQAIKPYVDGYDVASIKEIKNLLSYGVDSDKITFSNPVKPADGIKKAYEEGVKSFAFQSITELAKIQLNAPASKVYARVKIDDSNSNVPLSGKFGCGEEELERLFRYAKKIGLSPTGITFHIGSQSTDPENWKRAIAKANSIVYKLREKNIDLNYINIGGGFAAKYYQEDPDISDAAKYVNSAIDKGSISYIAEPGRFIVADSAVIISEVIGVEKRLGKDWAFIDVGLYQAFLGALRYDEFPYQPLSLTHYRNKKDISIKENMFVLTGPTCDSNDTIHDSVKLPSDISVGDKLLFPNVGAYTVVYGSSFNGFDVPKVYFIQN